MALTQTEVRVAVCATGPLVKSIIVLFFCIVPVVCAHSQEAQPTGSSDSWTGTTQTSMDNPNPSRTTETHAKDGNRTVDTLHVEVFGLSGRYQPDHEAVKEVEQLDPATTHTVERTYKWDLNGEKYLLQVTEEDARTSASGDGQVVRTISTSDGNGNLQLVQRHVADTKQTAPNMQETITTFYLLNGSGELAPYAQTDVLQERGADHTVEVKTTTLVPDSSGNWEVSEVKANTIKGDGNNQTSEESVSRSDSEGRFSEVSRTIGNETETAAGEKSTTAVTYSTELPGSTPDGSLHLTQRETTLQKMDSGGKITVQEIEQPNPGDPTAGLRETAKTEYIVQYGPSGMQQTETIQVRDDNGAMNVVSVETRNSNQAPGDESQITPSDISQ